MEANDIRLEFLRKHGAASASHSGKTLIDHLCAVHDLLLEWNAPSWLCDAGLFHSVYGTESYSRVTIPLELRSQVQRIIHPRAEELAYIFGVMTKESFRLNNDRVSGFSVVNRFSEQEITIDLPQWAALCELFIANAIEQLARVTFARRQSFSTRYYWVRQYVSPSAARAFNASLEMRTAADRG